MIPEATTRGPRLAQEIEVVTNEPHNSRRNEPIEELGAGDVMVEAAHRLADIVEQRGEPELPIVGLATSEIERLERMVKRVAFGVKLRILGDTVQRGEEGGELLRHI